MSKSWQVRRGVKQNKGRLLPPVVGWAVLALLHRYWPALLAVGLGIAVLAVWQARRRRR